MNHDRPRRPTSARDQAEALFKPAAPKAPPVIEKRPALPGAKEMVTLRIDRDVLDHFQSGGPGWQDRVNDALRQAAGLVGDDVLKLDDLNSSNDG
ncbi:BrnA antitoxin family protein [Bosea sp. 2KB_26]|uniref:BrnA antitoxin family protein n=1 Tax=Pseudomonadota TaxID=1224 RepID=UPI000DE54FC7